MQPHWEKHGRQSESMYPSYAPTSAIVMPGPATDVCKAWLSRVGPRATAQGRGQARTEIKQIEDIDELVAAQKFIWRAASLRACCSPGVGKKPSLPHNEAEKSEPHRAQGRDSSPGATGFA